MPTRVLEHPKTEVPLPRRGGPNQVLSESGKPLLVIVEGTDVGAMVDAGLQAIGGLRRIMGASHSVLLKPNTNQRDPFPSTTDPATIRAVARHCRAAGAAEIIVHEDHKAELDLYYRPEELPGLDIQLSHSPTSGDFVLVEHEGWQGDKDVPASAASAGGMMAGLRDYIPERGPRLRVARQIQEASVVINLPVLKRHFAGQITSALKNHFGSVYGPQRWLAHSTLQTNRDYYDRKLVEFASAVRPELTITDARSIQGVFGPFVTEQTRIIPGVNTLIITGDMVAADAVALDLMKRHDATFTPENERIVRRQFQLAEELALGSSDLSRFEIVNLKV